MQDANDQSINLTRRGAMTIGGAAVTAATVPTTGVVLAQSTPETAAALQPTRNASGNSVVLAHKRANTNGITLHYVMAGRGPVVLCVHGWPQNHREFLPVMERLSDRFTFIAPDLRGYADSDKPYDGYEPKTIAQDMLGLLKAEDI